MRIFFIVVSMLCMSISAHAKTLGTDDHSIRLAAEKTIDAMIEGLRSNNYGKYSHNFHPSLLEQITEAHFKKSIQRIEKTVGTYLYRDYMGFLTKSQTTLVLWKARFSRSEDDLIIVLTLSKEANIVFVKDIQFNKL